MKYVVTIVLLLASCTSGLQKPTSSQQPPPLSKDSDDWAPAFKTYRAYRQTAPESLAQMKFNEPQLERWRQYTLATRIAGTDSKTACLIWEKLGTDKTFALARLSQLRQSLTCPDQAKNIEFISDEKSIYDDLLADKAMQDSAKTESLTDDVDALLEKARLTAHYQDREELFNQALEAAKKSKDKARIEKAQAALYKNSPRLNPAPKKEELFSVASDYRLWRQFDPALKIYKKILASNASNDDKYNALKQIKQTLKTADKKEEALKAAENLSKWAHKRWLESKKNFIAQKRLHDSQTTLMRDLWTAGQTKKALGILEQTEKWLSGHYPMDEVYFLRSRVAEESKDLPLALSLLQQAAEEKTSQKTVRDDILWAEAWLQYKAGKFEEAINPFKEIADNTTEAGEKARALYWLARTYQKVSKNSEAKDTFNTLIKEDPLGYYGLLAHRDLNEKIPLLKLDNESSFDERLSAASVSANYRDQTILIDWLVAVGENSLAEKALNRLSDQLRKNSVTDEDLWIRVSSQYAQSGLYLPLFSALSQLKPEVRKNILDSHPEFLFPQPYREVVEKAAAETGVPSAFIYAIMRQESSFNPKARSGMDAYGLMQLLPSLAKVRAEQVKVPYKKATDLFNPEINVPLGAAELKALLKKFDSQYIMAIAAYNANEKALKNWLNQRYRQDSVEFIEEVPYRETRNYLKLVLRNYIFYLRFQSAEDFNFPESCLRLSQDQKSPSQTEIN